MERKTLGQRTAAIMLVVAGAALVGFVLWNQPPPVADWTRVADDPVARVEAANVRAGGRLYVFGGFVEGPRPRDLYASAEAHVYDLASNRWEALPDLPSPVTHLNAVEHRGLIWFAGGFVGNNPGIATDAVFSFDLESRRYSQAPPLPDARAGGGLAVADGGLHYFGGFGADRNTTYGDHYRLDLAHPAAWERRAPMPIPRGHLAAITYDDAIYAVGGQFHHDDDPLDVAYVHRYIPETDQWEERASLPREGWSHFEGAIDLIPSGFVIFGGRDTATRRNRWFRSRAPFDSLDEVASYDARTDRWRELPRLAEGVTGAAVRIIGDRVLLVGGGSDGPFAPLHTARTVPLSQLLGNAP